MTTPYGNQSYHTTPRVPYNYNMNGAAHMNNPSLSRMSHTMYSMNDYRNYSAVFKPPHGNYNVPAVSTMPGTTVITVPTGDPHSNYTVLKIPTPSNNVTVLTAAESDHSTSQPLHISTTRPSKYL